MKKQKQGELFEFDQLPVIPSGKAAPAIKKPLKQRAAEFSWTFPKNDYPRYLNLFVKNVGSMAKGGIWER